ncbi:MULTISPECIES: ABC transporter ATP-binding protein [Pseudoalteromonas]|uniref:ABC-type antimicrobial peptide transport system, ATPase component n=1 Tax=Pseudoalteromonas luteoviolacea (strain 2ta16) TaxID=1353533 RepID=V4HVY7_PSEL2|nr:MULTISPECIES: ABC transporter ATP-binding protein [Pseudoalteromonas]ESP93938.1 ABC-type antimicrobial peptide transport system, ATPase component [Pseudoalteromonas luteoviolacea 2ta16]KZN31028.1 ABC transporter [Pseudoalteromonas luteoviolacea NCIMB 1944]MCG7548617.1 ABC transporter ATP-binding protein [Pseudoalteromonas sp. Of7M-16]
MIKLTNISKHYRTDEILTTALSDINLSLPQGEFMAIMGPSGCGKSTLLNVLGMLDTPSEGKYEFMGEEIANYKESQLAKIRKEHVGVVFQEFNLIDELSVIENVEVALLYHKMPKAKRRELALEMLKKVGMDHRIKHYPGQLSGGQQQRVAIARALVNKPKLIVADEPTGNLDSNLGREIMELISDINKTGTSVIMVTHSEAHAQYANQILTLLDGKLVSGSLEQSIAC